MTKQWDSAVGERLMSIKQERTSEEYVRSNRLQHEKGKRQNMSEAQQQLLHSTAKLAAYPQSSLTSS